MFNFFDKLPDEMVFNILKKLSLSERIKIMRTYHRFYSLIQDRQILDQQEKFKLSEKTLFTIGTTQNDHVSRTNVVKALFKMGADQHEIYSNQTLSSLLHGAVLGDDWTTTIFLLEKGAKVNYQNACRQTALHYAAREGSPRIAKLLIEHGADPNITDYQGKKPADLANDPKLAAAISSNSSWEIILTEAATRTFNNS